MATSAKVRRSLKKANFGTPVFDVKLFLDSAGLGRNVVKFRGKETVFTQGDPAKQVMYIQEGGAKLTVVNESGKAAPPRNETRNYIPSQSAGPPDLLALRFVRTFPITPSP
jgi:CRP-like cAMP-binding protein